MIWEALLVTEVGRRGHIRHLFVNAGNEGDGEVEGGGEQNHHVYFGCVSSLSVLVGTCIVLQNRAAVSMGSVATEHPPPRKMGAVWFGYVLVQNLKYSSKATSALHFGGDRRRKRSEDTSISCPHWWHAHLGVISRLQLKVILGENTTVIVYPVHSKLCSWDGTCVHQMLLWRLLLLS